MMNRALIILILSNAFMEIYTETFEEMENEIESDEQSREDLNSNELSSNEYEYSHDDWERYLEGFTPHELSDAWCPSECEKEGHIYEHPNLSSYCKCELVEGNLRITKHKCPTKEIYNETIFGCHKLIGNGSATCVIQDKQCPFNETGIRKHPNDNLYKNYVVCLTDKIIVAECDATWYYNENEKQCKPQTKKDTALLYSDCEQLSKIDCQEPGITFVEEYFHRYNKSILIPDQCKNCYYMCNDRNLEMFDLTIQCFPELTTGSIPMDYQNATIQYVTDYSTTSSVIPQSKSFISNIISTDTTFISNPTVETNLPTSFAEASGIPVFTDILRLTETAPYTEATTMFVDVTRLLDKDSEATSGLSSAVDKIGEPSKNITTKLELAVTGRHHDKATTLANSTPLDIISVTISEGSEADVKNEKIETLDPEVYVDQVTGLTRSDLPVYYSTWETVDRETSPVMIPMEQLIETNSSTTSDTTTEVKLKESILDIKKIGTIQPENVTPVADFPVSEESTKINALFTSSTSETLGVTNSTALFRNTGSTEIIDPKTLKTIVRKTNSETTSIPEERKGSTIILDLLYLTEGKESFLGSTETTLYAPVDKGSTDVPNDFYTERIPDEFSASLPLDKIQLKSTTTITQTSKSESQSEEFILISTGKTEETSAAATMGLPYTTQIAENYISQTYISENITGYPEYTQNAKIQDIFTEPTVELQKNHEIESGLSKTPITKTKSTTVMETPRNIELSTTDSPLITENIVETIKPGTIQYTTVGETVSPGRVHPRIVLIRPQNTESLDIFVPLSTLSEIQSEGAGVSEISTPTEITVSSLKYNDVSFAVRSGWEKKETNPTKGVSPSDTSEKTTTNSDTYLGGGGIKSTMVSIVEDLPTSPLIDVELDRFVDNFETESSPGTVTATDKVVYTVSSALSEKSKVTTSDPKSEISEIIKYSEGTTEGMPEKITSTVSILGKEIKHEKTTVENMDKTTAAIYPFYNKGDITDKTLTSLYTISEKVKTETQSSHDYQDLVSTRYQYLDNETSTGKSELFTKNTEKISSSDIPHPGSIYGITTSLVSENEPETLGDLIKSEISISTDNPKLYSTTLKIVEEARNVTKRTEDRKLSSTVPTLGKITSTERTEVTTEPLDQFKPKERSDSFVGGSKFEATSNGNTNILIYLTTVDSSGNVPKKDSEAREIQNVEETTTSILTSTMNLKEVYNTASPILEQFKRLNATEIINDNISHRITEIDNPSETIDPGKLITTETILTGQTESAMTILDPFYLKNRMGNIPTADAPDVTTDKIQNMTQYSTSIYLVTTINATTENIQTLHELTVTTTPESNSMLCQPKKGQICEKEGYFRYNNSCTMHYECYYSDECKKVIPSDIYECPSCLKFNAKLMRCDTAENVPECTYRRKQFTSTCTGPGKFPVPDDITRYYECTDRFNNGEYMLTVKVCPQNKKFNTKTGRCRKYRCGITKCDKPQVVGGECGRKHYVHDLYDCRKFFHCQNGKPKVSLSCPEEYIFNGSFCQSKDTTLFCNWEELKKYLYKHKKL